MAKNFRQPGETVTLTAPTGGVLSGDGFVVGNVFAVAAYDAVGGAEVEGTTVGVWTLPKATGVINEGARVWWDNSAKAVKAASATGLYPIGVAVAAAADATVDVRLDGIAVIAA
jgi:predicted RecA/RadA family phage recombinase